MKPSLCEQCIVYPSCTKSCIPHAHEGHSLNHQIQKMRRFIFSTAGHRRKTIKEKHRKHYNSLVEKMNKNVEEREGVRLRHNRKHYGDQERFEGSFSGQMLQGEGVVWEIDKMILENMGKKAARLEKSESETYRYERSQHKRDSM